MPYSLRIIQQEILTDHCTAKIEYRASGNQYEAVVPIPLRTSPEDEEKIRWYLEEYLRFPTDPAPEIARNVETRMREIGTNLFDAIFKENHDGERIWQSIRNHLAEIDFEIIDECGVMIHWELIQDPLDQTPIACAVNSFVRLVRRKDDASQSFAPQHLLRVLLVISRPAGDSDVAFRSIAGRLLAYLSNYRSIKVEVLRPATFEALETRLQQALVAGTPFNMFHFDGHGKFANPGERHGIKQRKRGYLIFEDPQDASIEDPQEGRAVGNLLAEYKIPIAILNACRSARSDAGSRPGAANADGVSKSFGSVAEELIKCGLSAVVAMQYNIYVGTAARFVYNLYAHLAGGGTLLAAVNLARRELFENKIRHVSAGTFELQDWIVPVLFLSGSTGWDRFQILETASSSPAVLSNLPPSPASGFIGRDNVLLALDRAFQDKSMVLLWGMAGSGKTATGVEFGKWMQQTSGPDGCVVFTSFASYSPVSGIVMEALSVVTGDSGGVEWLHLQEQERLQLMLEIMDKKRCLWIWDNMESVTSQDRPEEEVLQLGGLLIKARNLNIRVLLTSRTNKLPWAIEDFEEVELPPMDQEERMDLTRAIIGINRDFKLAGWAELLEFSRGIPFVLSLLVRQAVSHGYYDADSLASFVRSIRAGDGEDLLDLSIGHALSSEFTVEEQKTLSLCWLFEGVFSASLLDLMKTGSFNKEKTAASFGALLDRVLALGIFEPIGSNYYTIHPGVSSFLKASFDSLYIGEEAELMKGRYTLVLGMISNVFINSYNEGTKDSSEVAILTLNTNEGNFRHALPMCLERQDWITGFALLYGLYILYKHYGRWAELDRLMAGVMPDYIDVHSSRALPGREAMWLDFLHIRVEIFLQSRRLSEAAQLQELIVTEKVVLAQNEQDSKEREDVRGRSLAFHVYKLAQIQHQQGLASASDTFHRALGMAQRGGDIGLESDIAFDLANVYMEEKGRNLPEAEYWLSYALDAATPDDRIRVGRIKAMLGRRALMTLDAGVQTGLSRNAAIQKAIDLLQSALAIIPQDMADARAQCIADLGKASFLSGNDQGQSMKILQESIKLAESVGDIYGVGKNQLNLARIYRAAGDRENSFLLADAALRLFASLAPEAESELLAVQDFLEEI